jgi:7-carboxy-7-deazaguanine synthase
MLTVAWKAPARAKTFPIIEIFGPTIQGEGAEAGLPTHFVRLGGCDYRCSWCDTMYAVDPAVVRRDAIRMGVQEICAALDRLAGAPAWVSLSGGNPALHHLGELVDALHAAGRLVSVETQGSVWRDWLAHVDRLTVSPKPPSSGMATPRHREEFEQFMDQVTDSGASDRAVLKVVCFHAPDLEWAKATASAYPWIPLLLSAGTPIPANGPVRELVGDRYRWLCEQVAADPELATVRVLPQLHVIAWKEARGV